MYSSSLKHPRPDDDDDDDHDDVSIVSRTPSPPPNDADGDVYMYDEYVRGTPREVITVETRIKPTNKGFAMLAKLGWSQGQPLGTSGDGRVDPIPFQIKRDSTGLGKTSQDVRMIETTVSQRRGLDSERQQKETEDQRRAREELVARKSALENEISTTLKAFYCSLCDKQFKNVAQYDEHTNSYAHHHKARFKDMQANVRLKPKEEIDKRKEKERKREEKELRKIAAANGIKMAKPTAAPLVPVDTTSSANTAIDVDTIAPTKKGWATVSGTGGQAPPGSSNPSGWASVGSGFAPREDSTSSISATGTAPISSKSSSAPAFRTAGWTSLDTGSSQAMPPAPATEPPPPPPPVAAPPPAPARGGWSSTAPSSAPTGSTGWSRAAVQPMLPSPPPGNPLPSIPLPAQPVRSGWQQFQKPGPKRR
ncbi:hypothetical protein D9615_005190 [Tricholomella constricta]|uniref:G-patch domain-containing protein n=1 Tax=Tricholomella constricta TaxID=117010 RepID=A0A8H5H6D3_9AGAR|nr:hypothetical protein D9615_005190 [Tricholomella constricta]